MDLDEIDPAKWALLDAATDQYIAREDAAFDSCARLLVHHMADTRGRLSHITTLALGQPPPHLLIRQYERWKDVQRMTSMREIHAVDEGGCIHERDISKENC